MGFRRKWKPNAAQKRAYLERINEKESLKTFTTPYAIREGCRVKFYSMSKGAVISGTVVNSSYGKSTGQHTFTIDTGSDKILVKGRNLYPNMLEHIQGKESLKV